MKFAAGVLGTYIALTILYCNLGYLDHINLRVSGIDGVYYYMYLPSVLLDGDIDFSNEVSYYFGEKQVEKDRTKTGMVGNHWPIGPAIFWAPFFLLAHFITSIGNSIGSSLPANGYSGLYTTFVYLANSLYGVSGFFFIYYSLKRFFAFRDILLACLVILLCSPLTYYLWSFSTMSHTISFFAVSMFIFAFLRYGIGLRLAICSGLMFLVRWQDILFILPLIIYVVHDFYQRRKKNGFLYTKWLAHHLGFVIVFFITVSPQLFVWKIIYGQWIMPASTSQKIDVLNLHTIKVLFGSETGFFAWHPILILGVIGLPILFKKRRMWGIYCSLAILIQVLFVASIQKSAGWAFGNRFLIGTLPFLTFGLAALFERIKNYRLLRSMAIVSVIFFCYWNQVFVFQYQKGLIPHSGPLTREQFIDDKFRIKRVYDSEKLFNRGVKLLEKKQPCRSLEEAIKADAIVPRREKVLLLKAVGSLLCKNYQQSQMAFQQLIDIKTSESLYKLGLAYSYFAEGKINHTKSLLEVMDDSETQWIRKLIDNKVKSIDPNFLKRIFRKLTHF